jgi:hypothetical protein
MRGCLVLMRPRTGKPLVNNKGFKRNVPKKIMSKHVQNETFQLATIETLQSHVVYFSLI